MNNFKNRRIVIIAAGAAAVLAILLIGLFISSSNPDGSTGGDFTKKNSINMINAQILYRHIGTENTDLTLEILEKAVIYNISVSNNPADDSGFVQIDSIKNSNLKVHKEGRVYVLKPSGSGISAINKMAWNYQLTVSSDDGRRFLIKMNVDPDSSPSKISVELLEN